MNKLPRLSFFGVIFFLAPQSTHRSVVSLESGTLPLRSPAVTRPRTRRSRPAERRIILNTCVKWAAFFRAADAKLQLGPEIAEQGLIETARGEKRNFSKIVIWKRSQ